jgi:hypothetical protein
VHRLVRDERPDLMAALPELARKDLVVLVHA